MRELTVAAVMTKDPVAVTPDTPSTAIAAILAGHGIGAVPVAGPDNVPIGVVSQADLARGGRASELMKAPVLAVDSSEWVSFAARALGRRGVRRVFVLDHGRLVGVVTRRDLLKVFLRSDDEIRTDIEREVFQRVLWADMAAVDVRVCRGAVTLSGKVRHRSEVDLARRLTSTIPGVIDVRNRLGHVRDDLVLSR